jgi:hypothetical protein
MFLVVYYIVINKKKMTDSSSMRPALRAAILESSVSNIFKVAAGEWYVNNYHIADSVTCVCGQEECRYIYSIKNWHNEKTLFPIGSSCMKYFNWNEEEADIINAYRKWHAKLYNNEGGAYHQIAFNQVIKDVDYIHRIKYCSSAENRRLWTYAKAVWIHNPPVMPEKKKEPTCEVWIHNPPVMPEKKKEPTCESCEIQKQKGYKRCYQCHLKKKK